MDLCAMSEVINTYRYQFVSECPADAALVIYKLEIASAKVIRVEHIRTAAALHRKGFHESIADELFARFGGHQTLVAVHQGVEIETNRGAM